MLNENIKTLRKQKGLSQEELSLKLNVVRQTVSKWEKGLSLPDSEMLIALAQELDTSVSNLLGENIKELKEDNLEEISKKLEAINLLLAKNKDHKRKFWHYFFIGLTIFLVIIFWLIYKYDNIWLTWNYNDPEWAITGTLAHGFCWVFVRLAPIILIGSIIGICLTIKRR